jgi:hypothetical protein
MASFASFPTELKEAVIAECSRHDLLNLARTSKNMHDVALPALYRKISLAWRESRAEGLVNPPITALIRNSLATRDMNNTPGPMDSTRELEFLMQNFDGSRYIRSLFNRYRAELRPEFSREEISMLRREDLEGQSSGPRDKSDLHRAITVLIWLRCTKLERLTLDLHFLLSYDLLGMLLSKALLLQNKTHEDAPFACLKSVTLGPGDLGTKTMPYAQLEQTSLPYDAFFKVFHLPALTTLDLAFFPDLDNTWIDESDDDDDNEDDQHAGLWDKEAMRQHTMSLREAFVTKITTLRLKQSFALPTTLGILLQHTPALTTLEYHLVLASTKTPLDCALLRNTLHPFRSTLKDLSIRCNAFANEAVEVEQLGTIRRALGPLRDFEALTTFNVSFAVLYGQARIGEYLPLADMLPPNLQNFTINDDFWGFDAFHWSGQQFEQDLRVYLTDISMKVDLPDSADATYDIEWHDSGKEPGWKTGTPHLKGVVCDWQRRRIFLQDDHFWDDHGADRLMRLGQDVRQQGLQCTILTD